MDFALEIFGKSSNPSNAALPIDVNRDDWLRFVKTFIVAKPAFPDFRLGYFGITVRRLTDLGAMKDPKVMNINGRHLWAATWINPKSYQDFLANFDAQYELFCQSMSDYADNAELLNYKGMTIDNKRATLSGLLAIAHRCGVDGAKQWFTNKDNRLKFLRTKDAFEKATGIF